MNIENKIINEFQVIKTLPHVAIKVTQLINSENCSTQEFEEIIKLDPILSARLIQLVNSPYFGFTSTINSISKSIVYLGMKQLRNLFAIEALRNIHKNKTSEILDRNKLWMHSSIVAILSELIAKRIFGMLPEDAFLAGIIHDIGFILQDQVVEAKFNKACNKFCEEKINIIECENEFIETNHCQLGSHLMSTWSMSKDICNAIKNHHDSENRLDFSSITPVLMISDYIACKVKYMPFLKSHANFNPYIIEHIQENIVDYKIIIKDLPNELKKAKELYDPSS